MRIASHNFSLSELAGALGGWGILLPLVMGYVAVCGLDPAGIFVTFGLVNLSLGLYYRLPLPLEPMKVIAVIAIAQAWSPSLIYASALAMGLLWLIFAATGIIAWVRKVTPEAVVRGISLSLGIMLFLQALKMLSGGWLLGGAAVAILLLSAKSRYAPGTVLIIGLGLLIVYFQGKFAAITAPAWQLPHLTFFAPTEIWESLLRGGFAQIPLTVTNAVILTATLIRTYWPERTDIPEQKLAWNHGIINSVVPFFGGIPMCHGAGSLAGKFVFGARTGGASVIEGLIQLTLGLFLAESLVGLFHHFPMAILGALLLFVSFELAKSARGPWSARETIPLLATVIPAVFINMAAGFASGLLVHYLYRRYRN